MADQVLEVTDIRDGKLIRRAVGDDSAKRPPVGVVGFDVNVSDKLGASRRWVLAYPGLPEGVS